MNENIDISVIIVNYNVEYFLEQCLNSTFKALENCKGEVFVVDNNSIDGSVDMVREKFPEAILIANKDNKGFSSANNQAMRIAKGRYVLLLNPDTVVEENTFEKCIHFMDKNPNSGGLGVRMLDGKGKFLPESKRGLPTPDVAFYKIFGISRLFPKSKKFGKYHLGYLDEFETNKIEILSGAYMMMRKEALDKVGLLDEDFFMYGEDIDLSWRIVQGGYDNYYFPETNIIHYKGESTKKSSVNYVFVFYRAMVIFARKHFSQKNAKLFSFLINCAIYFRAGVAIVSRFIKKAVLPTIDALYIIGGLLLLTFYWSKESIDFPVNVLKYALPSYGIVWMLSVFFNGGYDKPIKLTRYLFAPIIGTGIILMIYALLPKEWQFSRLYILIGTLWISTYYILSRIFIHFAIGKNYDLKGNKNKNFAIVGSTEESERVADILKNTSNKVDFIGYVSTKEKKTEDQVGSINQLDQIVHIHDIDEVIFCAKDSSAKDIIMWMSQLESNKLDFKIAQPDSLYLIGSNSVDTSGDMYVLNINAISQPSNRRNKRTLDIIFSLTCILLSPILMFLFKNKGKFFKNIFSVFFGKQSVVGYNFQYSTESLQLPKIKSGVLTPSDIEKNELNDQVIHKLNLIYARDYKLIKDIQIIKQAWRNLDR